MRRMEVGLLVSAAALLGMLVCGCAAQQEMGRSPGPAGKEKGPREITVRGVAEVIVPPDYVTVNVRVVTLDMDLAKAQADNDTAVKAALAFIDELGIEAGDLSTSYVSLGPKWRRVRDEESVFEGFEASKSIAVKLRDLSKYDELLSGMLKLGVNRISGISFGSSDELEKRREARILAIRAAREKAEYLARELGQKVGRPLWVAEFKKESFGPSPMSNVAYYGRAEPEAKADTELGTIAPGSITIRAEVEASFELKD